MSDTAYGVTIIGGGLAGVEAAWAAAERGVHAHILEMRPLHTTAAHQGGFLAELVCSNSFRSTELNRAAGVLKEEMRRLGSLVIDVAESVRVPAGIALAVDREGFARAVTERIEGHPMISISRERAETIPASRPTIIATGPLTDGPLADALEEFVGEKNLAFFDAAAPIIARDSIDMTRAFVASRYEKGDAAYINCPLDEEVYDRFVHELASASVAPRHLLDEERFFSACMPIEELVRKGRDTLRFGPMKPVGLIDPHTGAEPYAVAQLRQDDRAGRLFNLVGFQTSLRFAEQERVFRMIPALEDATFIRYGVMHRNTFMNAPTVLSETLSALRDEDVLFAGQLTGSEGYAESAATGLLAGLNAVARIRRSAPVVLPPTTLLGSLVRYLTTAESTSFQPMHVSFGLLDPLPARMGKRRRFEAYGIRALADLDDYISRRSDLL